MNKKKPYNSLFHLPTLVRPKDLLSVSPEKHLDIRARNGPKMWFEEEIKKHVFASPNVTYLKILESEKKFRNNSKLILDSSLDIQPNPQNLLTSNNLRKRSEKIKTESKDASCCHHIYKKPENHVNIIFTIKRNNKLKYISQQKEIHRSSMSIHQW